MLQRLSAFYLCLLLCFLPMQSFAASLNCLHSSNTGNSAAVAQTSAMAFHQAHSKHAQADVNQHQHQHQHHTSFSINKICKTMCAIWCASCASVALVSHDAKPTTPDVSALAIAPAMTIYASINLKNPQRPPIFFS